MIDPVVVTPTAPTPSWSAKLLVFVLAFLGGIPATHLLDNHPTAQAVAALLVTALVATGYIGHKKALKQTHAAATAAATSAK
jgi:hypothetical protein